MAWTAEQMAQKRAKLQKKTNAAAGGAEPLSPRKSADSRNPLALGSTGNSVSDNSNPWKKWPKNVRHCKPRNSRRAPTCTPRRWRITGQGTTWALRMPWTTGATS